LIKGSLHSVLGESNLSIANETLEEVNIKKEKCLFLKVDYEKTYDSVNWDFLFYMLMKVGFCNTWSTWIKACLVSSSTSVLVNRSPTVESHMGKDLRQGNPLAPFLFLIVVRIVRLKKERGELFMKDFRKFWRYNESQWESIK